MALSPASNNLRNVQNYSESSTERMTYIKRADGSVEVYVEKEPNDDVPPVAPVRPMEPMNVEVKPVQSVSQKELMITARDNYDSYDGVELYYNPLYYKN